jgi:hypothetical protein
LSFTSIEKEDLGLYAKILAHDPGMVNFGSSDGPIVGWEALKKVIADQNAALSETKIGVSDLYIHLSGDGKMGWATRLEIITFHGPRTAPASSAVLRLFFQERGGISI